VFVKKSIISDLVIKK